MLRIVLLLLLAGNFMPGLRAQTTLKKQINDLLREVNAEVGVAACFNDGPLFTVNNHTSYPMLSTFKFPLALAVLHDLDKNRIPLDTKLYITPEDLKANTYSPLREARPEGHFTISIRELLQYTVALSDNNTCDILLRYVGGPQAVQQYLDRLQIEAMQIAVTEEDMHRNPGNVPLNATTPEAAVKLIERFLTKELLSAPYQEFLEKTLIETSTGQDKIKGLLPKGTVVGHKTGSSDRDEKGLKLADNDMGFIRLPNGTLTLAVFVTNSMESDQTNARIIAQISKAIYDYYSRQPKQKQDNR